MSKGIWQFVVPAVIVVLLFIFLQKPLEELFYQKPKPIQIAQTQYGQKFCPNNLYGNLANFNLQYTNVGNKAGVFTVELSGDNVTVRYGDSGEFKKSASKSWYVDAGQPVDYNFMLNYTRLGQFEGLAASMNVRADLKCTYEISLPIPPLTCESFTKCCKYTFDSLASSYKLTSEQC